MLGLVPVGAGDEHAVVGVPGTRGPHLLAVHHPFVAVAHGTGADAREVRPGTRFAVEEAHGDLIEEQCPHESGAHGWSPCGDDGARPQVVDVLTGTGCADPGELGLDRGGGVVVEGSSETILRPAQRRPFLVDDESLPFIGVDITAPVRGEKTSCVLHNVHGHPRMHRHRCVAAPTCAPNPNNT